jgi:recombination protein RecR
MSRYAEPMARLIEELKKLPGVGTKSAQRFAFHILRSTDDDAAALAEAVRGLKASLRLCSICNNVTDVDPCAYCTSPTRNQRLVCVVEEPTSIESVERTRGYQGVYHVLHGTLSPLHGVGPDQLRTGTLIARVERGEVDEVILATSPTLEGEATANWLAGILRGWASASRASPPAFPPAATSNTPTKSPWRAPWKAGAISNRELPIQLQARSFASKSCGCTGLARISNS